MGALSKGTRPKSTPRQRRDQAWKCLQPPAFNRLANLNHHAMHEMKICCDEEIAARRANFDDELENRRAARQRKRRRWTGAAADVEPADVIAPPSGSDFLASMRSSAVDNIRPATMLAGLLTIIMCCGKVAFEDAPDVFLQRFVQSYVRNQWRCATYTVSMLHSVLYHVIDETGALPIVCGLHICKKCFSLYHGVSEWTLTKLIRKRQAGEGSAHGTTGRGAMRPKTLHALEWIDNRVKMLGDFMPHKSYIHLPPGSKDELYQTYVLDCQLSALNDCVTRTTFFNLMSQKFPRVKIPKQKRFAKCDECESFDTRIRSAFSDATRQQLRKEKSRHLDFVVQERRKYYKHRRKAASDPISHPNKEYMSLIIDGMDQAKTQVPRVRRETSSTKNLYGVPYVTIGVLDHGHEPTVYTFPSQFAKDSSLTCDLLSESIRRHFERERMPSKSPRGKKRVLYVQLDNAGSENKNYAVMGMFALLVHFGVFDKIKVSFLPVGHTHEDVDQMFSCIARALRKCSVIVPSELMDIMRGAYTPRPEVLDVDKVRNYHSIEMIGVFCVLYVLGCC